MGRRKPAVRRRHRVPPATTRDRDRRMGVPPQPGALSTRSDEAERSRLTWLDRVAVHLGRSGRTAGLRAGSGPSAATGRLIVVRTPRYMECPNQNREGTGRGGAGLPCMALPGPGVLPLV